MDSANSLDQLFRPLFNVSRDVTIFWMVMKGFFILAFFMYLLFAIIVVRQVFMMTQTFRTDAEFILKLFSFLHLFFAIGVLVASFLIL